MSLPENTYSKFSDSLLNIVKGAALYSGNSKKAFREITEAATNTINIERASIWMYSEDRSSIRCMDLYQLTPDEHSKGEKLSRADFPAYFAAMAKDRIIDANHAHRDPRTSEFSKTYLTPLGIESLLDAPIRFGGQTIGVICLEQVVKPRAWTTDEIIYAGSLADLVSHAVEAQKRSRAESALLESEAFARNLYENNETAMWSEDLTGLYDLVYSLGLQGIDDIRLYLKENEDDVWRVFDTVKRSYFNRSSLKLFNAQTEEELQNYFVTTTQSHLSLPLDLRISELVAIHEEQPAFKGEIDYLSIDGKEIRSVFSYPIPKTRNEFKNVPISIFDITEFKKLEEELLAQSQIINNIEEGACLIKNTDESIVFTNRGFDQLFGYAPGELLGKDVSIVNAPAEFSPAEVTRNIHGKVDASGIWRGELKSVKKDGTVFWCSVSVTSYNHPIHGDVRVSISTDITQRKGMDAKLSYQASHDALTGLINRNEFEQRITRVLSTALKGGEEHAMCFLDLDQFKVINDNCGHAAGDELLRQLGRSLQEAIRKRDTLARLGGDEFGVLMEHCTLRQAHRVANDILKTVKDYQFFWDGKVFRIGVSIGLVAITETSGNFTDVFKQADAACYLAKDLGRNRIHTYHPDDTELAVRHGEMQWVGRIHQALDDDRYCLYAQPIVPLDGSEHRHYEMLLRMIDETGKVIPPGAFLPAAERYSLIGTLDRWVVENGLTLLSENPTFTDRIYFISINLSGQSLTSSDFLDFIMGQIKNTGVEASKVCFEITETLAISNLVAARTFIKTLKDLGCHFALDDFGSGLSSFGYLKNLPVDYLKIDGMFVKDIVDDPIDHAMVKSINEIGQVMGMQTIAEFVENDEIKAMLAAIGVDYVQGYGVGIPLPFDEIVEETYFRLG